ncbi:MAG: phosphatase RsbU N-terminal domain-containing protein [Propionibacteriaceae bacterium]
MNATEALQRDYRVAFLRYLSSRDEIPLTIAYELGRRAVADRLSILELSRIHHETFRLVVLDARPAELDGVVQAASEFFLEVLATFHMMHGQAG